MGSSDFALDLTFGTIRTAELAALQAGKEISWYSFLLEAEWFPGLLNADRRIRLLENIQGSHRELNPHTPSCGAMLQ
jgi:hypothetical protein